MKEDGSGSAYDKESMAIIKLNNTTVLYLKEVTKFLALVCILREESFERKGKVFFKIFKKLYYSLFKFFSFKIFFFYSVCVCLGMHVHVHVYVPHICSAGGGQKKALAPLELELQGIGFCELSLKRKKACGSTHL